MTSDKNNFYGWKLIAAVFMIYLLNTAFPYYGGSVLNAIMASDLSFSRSTLGFGFSGFILLVGLTSPLVGLLVNRLGVRFALTSGGLILTLGALAMATIAETELHYLLFFGALCGFGFSLGGIIPVQSVVTYWFKRRKPLAMSIVLCASGVGSIVSIPILNAVVEASDNNWRIGWYVVAVTSMISALTALLWVRNKPEDLGQLPDGGETASAAQNAAARRPSVFVTDIAWSTAQAVRAPASWLIAFSACAFTMVFNFCIAHGVVHLRDQGVESGLTATSVSLLVVASILGRLGCGTIGAHIEPRLIWSFGLACSTVGALVLSVATQSWHVYSYALLVGIGFGASYVSMANMMGNYFGSESFAPLLGILTTITCLVGALSPALGGITYDQTGDYLLAFYTLAAISGAGVVCILLATPPHPAASAGN